MKYVLPLLVAAALALSAANASAQRQNVPLPDGWKFLKHDAAPDAPVSDEWQAVSVPHCWNALDGQNGKAAEPEVKDGYYRGPAWYVRSLDIPADWKDKRVFVRFGAAFLVADVYLNGEHLGQHRGGFAAFCYELTPNLKLDGTPNELRVRVDNAKNPDIAPLSADFTMEGGLYRPVELLVTGRTCITPLDSGGPGVYVTTGSISRDRASLTVDTMLDGTGKIEDGRLVIETSVMDADGKGVLQSGFVGTVSDGAHRNQYTLRNPHLWNGISDPYMYSVRIRLRSATSVNNERPLIDEVTVPLGLRTVAIDNDKGFLLNGQPYPIHGVNRHQEKRGQGWALSDADQDADFQTIRELGATAVRLAHYQQAEHVHDICDHNGILLWQEIPLVNVVGGSEAFLDNAKQQLIEMIRQGSNHPSIMTWSLFNELTGADKDPPAVPLITALDKLARELDPARTPTSVTCHADKIALDRITEWVGCNIYPGWYAGTPEDFDKDVQKYWEAVGGNKRLAVTEYGAGANPAQHQEGKLVQPKANNNPFHPEEWQAYVHERAWAQAKDNPHLWGTFIWCMFDFASDGRNEGSNPGVNDKGMVTEDRQIKKDAFFFYKANWNPAPMVYLASRRLTPRKEAQTEVKAYSNCGEVELKVNGQSIGLARPDHVHVCRWPDVTLQPGENRIEAVTRANDGKEISDHCEWTLEAPEIFMATPAKSE